MRLFISVLIMLLLPGLFGALAGTEDGSFCPTCPDWTNLDGWYRQKEAYSQSQLPPALRQTAEERTLEVKSVEKSYEVREIMADVEDLTGSVLIDSRSPEEYAGGHIPGARNIWWRSVRSGESINASALVEALRGNGVNTTDRIVVYGEESDASYLFWSLEYIGHRNISLLDGGVDAWLRTGKVLVRNSPSMPKSDYSGNINEDLLVKPEDLEDVIDGAQIIDTRESFADFGRSRIRGAIQIPVSTVIANGTVRDAASLESIFSGRGLDRGRLQIVYGDLPDASIMYYCLRLMGYRAALLDGDWKKAGAVVGNIR
ncbi:MAG TPA: rhodanese-like domain-containing protein [Methanothrix sp.]|nr:rhodanese-like domain-containing protein [Methanothrix sp.]HOK57556.1 rhodanese-like domain-containing protein [Methanothrix sp.]HOL42906.1 rhodanese-like domain-containing protein [Methanothrix sp.]HPO87841.1 rhodanese-like domain-containing protein [Methanothrix sp.]